LVSTCNTFYVVYNHKTNDVPNLLHIETKKNPINSTPVKLIGPNE